MEFGGIAPSNEERGVEKAMDEYLKSIDLHRKKIAKDGSCLFRAVAEQVLQCQSLHTEVRAKCVEFLKQNRESYEAFIEGDFEEYLYKLQDPQQWVGEVEINALAVMYKRDFLIFQEPGKPAVNITDNNFKDKVRLCFLNGNHYDSVYPISHIKNAAVCQSILYELLYDGVFKVDRSFLGLCQRTSRPTDLLSDDNMFACASSDESDPDTGDALWVENGTSLTSTRHSSQTYRGRGRGRQLPERVRRSLNPTLLRNIEYDVWQKSKRAQQKMDYCIAAGMHFSVGDHCQVRLDGSGRSYGATIKEVPPNNGPVTVYIEELGRRQTVSLWSLRPPSDGGSWSTVANRDKKLSNGHGEWEERGRGRGRGKALPATSSVSTATAQGATGRVQKQHSWPPPTTVEEQGATKPTRKSVSSAESAFGLTEEQRLAKEEEERNVALVEIQLRDELSFPALGTQNEGGKRKGGEKRRSQRNKTKSPVEDVRAPSPKSSTPPPPTSSPPETDPTNSAPPVDSTPTWLSSIKPSSSQSYASAAGPAAGPAAKPALTPPPFITPILPPASSSSPPPTFIAPIAPPPSSAQGLPRSSPPTSCLPHSSPSPPSSLLQEAPAAQSTNSFPKPGVPVTSSQMVQRQNSAQETQNQTSGPQNQNQGSEPQNQVLMTQTSVPQIQTSVPQIQTSVPQIQTSVPQIQTQTSVPQIQTQTSVPQIQTQTSVPQIQTQTSVPQIQTQTSVPQIQTQTSVPQIQTQTSVPQIQTQTSVPQIQTQTSVPQIQTQTSVLQTQTESSVAQIQTSVPHIQTSIPQTQSSAPLSSQPLHHVQPPHPSQVPHPSLCLISSSPLQSQTEAPPPPPPLSSLPASVPLQLSQVYQDPLYPGFPQGEKGDVLPTPGFSSSRMGDDLPRDINILRFFFNLGIKAYSMHWIPPYMYLLPLQQAHAMQPKLSSRSPSPHYPPPTRHQDAYLPPQYHNTSPPPQYPAASTSPQYPPTSAPPQYNHQAHLAEPMGYPNAQPPPHRMPCPSLSWQQMPPSRTPPYTGGYSSMTPSYPIPPPASQGYPQGHSPGHPMYPPAVPPYPPSSLGYQPPSAPEELQMGQGAVKQIKPANGDTMLSHDRVRVPGPLEGPANVANANRPAVPGFTLKKEAGDGGTRAVLLVDPPLNNQPILALVSDPDAKNAPVAIAARKPSSSPASQSTYRDRGPRQPYVPLRVPEPTQVSFLGAEPLSVACSTEDDWQEDRPASIRGRRSYRGGGRSRGGYRRRPGVELGAGQYSSSPRGRGQERSY
uniref:ubiquitinyl hydrolase 1 n=1 Tax=Amphiprion percula TaxID=161767 RepID=A0A3P8T7T4_AMPPE